MLFVGSEKQWQIMGSSPDISLKENHHRASKPFLLKDKTLWLLQVVNGKQYPAVVGWGVYAVIPRNFWTVSERYICYTMPHKYCGSFKSVTFHTFELGTFLKQGMTLSQGWQLVNWALKFWGRRVPVNFNTAGIYGSWWDRWLGFWNYCPARIKQYLKSLSLSFIVKMDKICTNSWRIQTAVLFELRKHLILTQFSG